MNHLARHKSLVEAHITLHKPDLFITIDRESIVDTTAASV